MKEPTNTTNKASNFGPFRWVAVATSLIFVLMAVFYFTSSQNSDQDLDSNFMASEESISTDLMLSTRGTDSGDDHAAALRMIREGMEYYNAKEYAKAIPIFQEYLEKNKDASDYNEIEFYLAVSFLSQGETERSAKMLEGLTKVEDQAMQEDVKWYLSLAYARNGHTDESRALLESLVTTEKYGAKANKILNPSKTKTAYR